MRILIVDDDPTSRRMLRALLINSGHDVVEAANGRIAWEVLQENPIRLVITDWMMPEIEGPDLIRHIREAPSQHYTYVMLVTAHESRDRVVDGLESGADDYLIKPFDPAELRARVDIGTRILDLEARLTEARAQMEYLAMHDGLTSLLNRRAIQEELSVTVQQAQRDGSEVSVLMVDIDHFKSVNDRYGHLVGDQGLRAVARALQRCTGQDDLVGRWGGEEFLMVLPRVGRSRAAEMAERLRMQVQATRLLLVDGTDLRLHISVGVASSEGMARCMPDTLVQRADAALYQAKREGRNRVCVSPHA